MAKRRYYPQEKANTCAVASLRTMLAVQFGVRIPEVALEALGTSAYEPIRKFGTGATELRRMLDGANRAFNTCKPWRVLMRKYGTIRTLSELTKERPVMCRLYRPIDKDEYHMVVVLGVTRTRLRVFDPAVVTGPFSLSHENFLAEWLDPEGVAWYAVLSGGGS